MIAAVNAAQRALGQLVGDFHVEALLWPEPRGTLVRLQAAALDDIRVSVIRGEITSDAGFAWLDAGRMTLAELRRRRSFDAARAIKRLMRDRAQ